MISYMNQDEISAKNVKPNVNNEIIKFGAWFEMKEVMYVLDTHNNHQCTQHQMSLMRLLTLVLVLRLNG